MFDCGQIEHALMEIADDLARDPQLVHELNLARELAKEWDEGAREFASLARLRQPTEPEIVARGQQAADFGFRVNNAAHHALRRIDALADAR